MRQRSEFFEYFLFYVSICGCVIIQVEKYVKDPYMDEVFHIPQAQKFCDGKFNQWDNMITTLPGLYIFTIIILSPLKFLGIVDGCNSLYLRLVNGFLGLSCYIVLYFILKKKKNPNAALISLALSMFPLHFFFNFLYYTDTGSTFFVLLSFLLSLHNKYFLSTLSSFISILFRQTNIIWTVFIAANSTISLLVKNIPKRKITEKNHSLKFIIEFFKYYFMDFENIILLFKVLWRLILYYGSLMIMFLVFIIVNDGIVVGARKDHMVAMHIPQLFYFFAFSCVFSAPVVVNITKFNDFFQWTKRRTIFQVILMICSLIFIFSKFTYIHRYLLADNRHYTFYVHRYILFRKWWSNYLLIPSYLFFTWLFVDSFKVDNIIYKILFIISLCLSLIPQALIELRYFIIPFIIWRIHGENVSRFYIIMEFILYCVINVFTFYMFIMRPFKWLNEPDKLQRFMW